MLRAVLGLGVLALGRVQVVHLTAAVSDAAAYRLGLRLGLGVRVGLVDMVGMVVQQSKGQWMKNEAREMDPPLGWVKELLE